jgi:predicted RNase H-like HicB family nuclease
MADTQTGRRPGESGLIPLVTPGWRKPERKAYRCQVFLLPEDDGGFSVCAATLPGVASQGKTEEEALANITKAFEGVFAAYAERGEPIPWLPEPRERERGAKVRWVVVHG